MSAAATTIGAQSTAAKPPKVSAWKNLRGLFPYLKRSQGGISLGLLALALMGIIGNIIPLAIGIIIDILPAARIPFRMAPPRAPSGHLAQQNHPLLRTLQSPHVGDLLPRALASSRSRA